MSCMEGEGSEKMTVMAAKEKSSFAVTCGLLSRYLREKKGGALQGLAGLDMVTAGGGGGGAFQPPTTMNLLSGLEEPKPNTVDVELSVDKGQLLKAPTDNQHAENPRELAAREEYAQQLTIFFGGKVVVFDNFPSTEVKALLQMANAADHAVDKAGSSIAVPKSLPHGNLPDKAAGDVLDKAGSSSIAVPQSLPRPAHGNLPDLPIARRNSLHRFLEKRKDRYLIEGLRFADFAPADVESLTCGPHTWWAPHVSDSKSGKVSGSNVSESAPLIELFLGKKILKENDCLQNWL